VRNKLLRLGKNDHTGMSSDGKTVSYSADDPRYEEWYLREGR